MGAQQKDLLILLEKYKVPNSELEKIGIIREKLILFPYRLSEEESKDFHAICYYKRVKKSDILRDHVQRIIECPYKKEEIKEIKQFLNENKRKDMKNGSFRLPEQKAKEFHECLYFMGISSQPLIRYQIIDFIRKNKGDLPT